MGCQLVGELHVRREKGSAYIPAENTEVSQTNWIAVEARHSDLGQTDPPSSRRRGCPVFICSVVFASLKKYIHTSQHLASTEQ
jgi:hypothetical protein